MRTVQDILRHILITFIILYYNFSILILVIVINLLLYLMYNLNSIIDTIHKKNSIYKIGTSPPTDKGKQYMTDIFIFLHLYKTYLDVKNINSWLYAPYKYIFQFILVFLFEKLIVASLITSHHKFPKIFSVIFALKNPSHSDSVTSFSLFFQFIFLNLPSSFEYILTYSM